MSHAGRHAAARPTTTSHTAPLRAAAAIGLALALLLAGCGDDDAVGDDAGGTTASTTTTSSASSTETTEDPEATQRQAVINAYLAAEKAAIEASAPPAPDPDAPALLATHTGLILERRRQTITGLRANGWAIRYPPNSAYREEVESVAFDGADVAILDVCAVDDAERFVVATGEVVASGLVTAKHTAAMHRVNGMWKLAERREEQQWQGEAGCAAD